jgi:large subunit ribosomal protein L28
MRNSVAILLLFAIFRKLCGFLQGRLTMSRTCYFTGKRTSAGRSISRRGKAKYLGGVGRKVTGLTKRKFKPNIQRVRAVVNGKVCRIKVSAKAMRMGLVTKPPKRSAVRAAEKAE